MASFVADPLVSQPSPSLFAQTASMSQLALGTGCLSLDDLRGLYQPHPNFRCKSLPRGAALAVKTSFSSSGADSEDEEDEEGEGDEGAELVPRCRTLHGHGREPSGPFRSRGHKSDDNAAAGIQFAAERPRRGDDVDAATSAVGSHGKAAAAAAAAAAAPVTGEVMPAWTSFSAGSGASMSSDVAGGVATLAEAGLSREALQGWKRLQGLLQGKGRSAGTDTEGKSSEAGTDADTDPDPDTDPDTDTDPEGKGSAAVTDAGTAGTAGTGADADDVQIFYFNVPEACAPHGEGMTSDNATPAIVSRWSGRSAQLAPSSSLPERSTRAVASLDALSSSSLTHASSNPASLQLSHPAEGTQLLGAFNQIKAIKSPSVPGGPCPPHPHLPSSQSTPGTPFEEAACVGKERKPPLSPRLSDSSLPPLSLRDATRDLRAPLTDLRAPLRDLRAPLRKPALGRRALVKAASEMERRRPWDARLDGKTGTFRRVPSDARMDRTSTAGIAGGSSNASTQRSLALSLVKYRSGLAGGTDSASSLGGPVFSSVQSRPGLAGPQGTTVDASPEGPRACPLPNWHRTLAVAGPSPPKAPTSTKASRNQLEKERPFRGINDLARQSSGQGQGKGRAPQELGGQKNRALLRAQSETERKGSLSLPSASSRILVRAQSDHERGNMKPKPILVRRGSELERMRSLGRRVQFSQHVKCFTYSSDVSKDSSGVS